MVLINSVTVLLAIAAVSNACTDFYMNFTNYKMSARTLDLGLNRNWTITTWSRGKISSEQTKQPLAFWPAKYGTVGLTANWFGDDHWGFPSLFGDSLNEKGLSCSLLTLINSQYEEKDESKTNIFAGLFCHYVAQTYTNVYDLKDALLNIAIWGPDPLSQHFVVRDASGASLIIELVGGKQHVYLDTNDGVNGYGIMTNEPTFDWHLENVKHYEWKRTLARQSVAVPGNFYPEERFMRVHMVKSGMEDQGLFSSEEVTYQQAFALTAQVLNTVLVPMGDQYGTDSGETSGEGDADHSVFSIIRDHASPALYWQDAFNPTFRRLALKDVDFSPAAPRRQIKLEDGPYFVDMAASFK